MNRIKLSSPPDACVNNEDNAGCKPDSKTIKDKLAESFGEQSFTVDFGLNDLYESSKDPACENQFNKFFVQFECV